MLENNLEKPSEEEKCNDNDYNEIRKLCTEMRTLYDEKMNRLGEMLANISMEQFTLNTRASTRAQNAIREAEIETLFDFVKMTEKDILRIRHCSKKTLAELKEILAEMGLHFGMKFPKD